MTNLEFYKDEIKKRLKHNGFIGDCAYQVYVKHYGYCPRNSEEWLFDWMLEEHKETIKLTLHEKCILESLPNDYKYIARDENGDLGIYKHEPLKCQSVWIPQAALNGLRVVELFNHLFKFIKWEDNEPYKIEDILNNCEVVEND